MKHVMLASVKIDKIFAIDYLKSNFEMSEETPLSDDEIKFIRKLKQDEQHMNWLIARGKIWLRYILAGLAVPPVLIAAYDAFQKMFR